MLLALSFPRFGHPGFAWIALVPLVLATAGPWCRPGRRPALHLFLLGLLAGGISFLGTLYWTGTVMEVYGGLSWPVATAVSLLLVAYLAIYPALFALVLGALGAWLGPVAILLSPAVWVATEYARGYLFTGFPWVLLGYSQVTVLPVAQLASVTGVFGLSGLVALVNALLAYAIVSRRRARAGAALAAAAAAVAGVVVWGEARLGADTLAHEGTPLTVGLVQGSIAQDQKWDEARASAILARYLALSREAASRGARLLVWPESSTPFMFEEDPAGAAAIRRLAEDTHTFVLIGSDQVEPGRPRKYYNAAFMIGPDGRTLGVYRKMHLVPFGEYVPLKHVFFFASHLVEAVSDFSPGEKATTLPVAGSRLSTSICYEVVYPDLVRAFVLEGAQLLTTITNDAWYGWSSAPYQHFEQAAMRAIEDGRYLVRSANTGISGIVDPYGRVLQRSAMFRPEVLVGQVRLLRGLTLYARLGDVVAYASIALTLLALGAGLSAAGRRKGLAP